MTLALAILASLIVTALVSLWAASGSSRWRPLQTLLVALAPLGALTLLVRQAPPSRTEYALRVTGQYAPLADTVAIGGATADVRVAAPAGVRLWYDHGTRLVRVRVDSGVAPVTLDARPVNALPLSRGAHLTFANAPDVSIDVAMPAWPIGCLVRLERACAERVLIVHAGAESHAIPVRVTSAGITARALPDRHVARLPFMLAAIDRRAYLVASPSGPVHAASARPAQARTAAPVIASKPTPKVRAKASAAVDNALALAKAANSVAELRAAVQSFEGCALKATARNTVFSDGVDDAEVLIIGETPGKEEDEQGKPFVGRHGQMLDRMLAAIGLDRKSNILISNTIYWRPPGNRDPTPGEIMACLPFVERLIELKQPKLLILAGKASANTVLKRDEAVTRLRGRRLSYTREGLAQPVNAMVMLHPAYLMRQPQQKRLAWADLLAAEAWLDELGVARVSPS